MPARSYGEVALVGATLFVSGWLSGSALSPPVATTEGQVRHEPRAHAVLPPPVPRLNAQALPRVSAPRPLRNPFTFDRRDVIVPAATSAAAEGPSPAVATISTGAEPLPPARPVWRMIGIASAADGTWTAIIGGPTDLYVVSAGDELPGGWVVESVDVTGARLVDPDGETSELPLG